MDISDHVTQRSEARVGTVLKGKWRLDRVLGVGGMATVYAATHRNQARVAIKMLHPEVAVDAEVTERFLREGYVANSVAHAGTVKVLDDDVDDSGAPFLVMEMLEGETLERRTTRKGKLELQEIIALGVQILDVLASAHDAGVVHRDLKPENLFLTKQGDLKILDFGIARLREITPEASRTRAGSLLGTPGFMAPEQARGRWDEVDHRTDLWAVGATLYSMLTGNYVHEAETVQEQLILAATQRVPSIQDVVPDLPTAFAQAVDRALSFDKNERWFSARDFQAALRACAGLDEGPLSLPIPSSPSASDANTLVAPPELTSAITGRSLSTSRPVAHGISSVSPPESVRARWPLFAAAAGLLLIGGGSVLYFLSPPGAQAEVAPPATSVLAAPPATVLQPLGKATDEPPAPPTPSASAADVNEKPIAHAKAPTPKPDGKPVVKPPQPKSDPPQQKDPGTKTVVPTPKPGTNPFDRRL